MTAGTGHGRAEVAGSLFRSYGVEKGLEATELEKPISCSGCSGRPFSTLDTAQGMATVLPWASQCVLLLQAWTGRGSCLPHVPCSLHPLLGHCFMCHIHPPGLLLEVVLPGRSTGLTLGQAEVLAELQG